MSEPNLSKKHKGMAGDVTLKKIDISSCKKIKPQVFWRCSTCGEVAGTLESINCKVCGDKRK